MVPDRPLPAPPKYWSSVSNPLFDSESGIENELSLDAPIVPTRAKTVTKIATHEPSTSQRRRNPNRPSRAHIDGRAGEAGSDAVGASVGVSVIEDIVGHSVH